jgi:hypothetical protein
MAVEDRDEADPIQAASMLLQSREQVELNPLSREPEIHEHLASRVDGHGNLGASPAPERMVPLLCPVASAVTGPHRSRAADPLV